MSTSSLQCTIATNVEGLTSWLVADLDGRRLPSQHPSITLRARSFDFDGWTAVHVKAIYSWSHLATEEELDALGLLPRDPQRRAAAIMAHADRYQMWQSHKSHYPLTEYISFESPSELLIISLQPFRRSKVRASLTWQEDAAVFVPVLLARMVDAWPNLGADPDVCALLASAPVTPAGEPAASKSPRKAAWREGWEDFAREAMRMRSGNRPRSWTSISKYLNIDAKTLRRWIEALGRDPPDSA